MDEFFLIAEIASVRDDGFVTIKSYSDFPKRFLRLVNAVIEIYGTFRPIVISEAVLSGDSVLLKFDKFEASENAKALLNCKLYVSGSDVVKLPDDTFFIHDLVGCNIYRNKEFIGKLIDVLTLPANDAYLVDAGDGKEIIIPATKNAVKRVDIENKTIYLNDSYELIDDVED